MRALFAATQGPDTAAAIAKLEAQRTSLPEPERNLVDRAIALVRSMEAATTESDPAKARPLRLAMVRATLALLDDMSAYAPDDIEVQRTVVSSLNLVVAQIESYGLAGDIPPRTVKQRARAIGEHLIAVHPASAMAWAIRAAVTPHSEPELRLRSLMKCVELEPTNEACKQDLEQERADYLLPYCTRAAIKGDFTWRSASRSPTPGSRPVEYFHETFYIAAKPTFSMADVIGIQATRTRSVYRSPDGKETTEWHDGIDFQLAPGKLDAMIAWSRELEQRGDSLAMLRGAEVLSIDSRAMSDDSTPGTVGVPISEVCVKTKTRALP
jgi:hypothetical protein